MQDGTCWIQSRLTRSSMRTDGVDARKPCRDRQEPEALATSDERLTNAPRVRRGTLRTDPLRRGWHRRSCPSTASDTPFLDGVPLCTAASRPYTSSYRHGHTGVRRIIASSDQRSGVHRVLRHAASSNFLMRSGLRRHPWSATIQAGSSRSRLPHVTQTAWTDLFCRAPPWLTRR